MTSFVVCLRSRLITEAVAQLVALETDLDAVGSTPSTLRSTIVSAGAVAAVVVDGESAVRIEPQDTTGLPVVVVGRREDDAGKLERVVAALALDTGAGGLIAALRSVVTDRVAPVERPARSNDRRRRSGDGPRWLTPREHEVLHLVAAASTPKEIAESMGLSEHTVRTHVQNVLAKLDAHSRVDAVARARTLGLLDAPPGR